MVFEINIILGILGIFSPIMTAGLLFLMKQMTEIKRDMAKLCERMAKEETKSDIYHGTRHDLEDK
jgi:thiamine phosphate synthase YjbQ (UPF0047 family)